MTPPKAEALKKELPKFIKEFENQGFPEFFEAGMNFPDGTQIKVQIQRGNIIVMYIEASMIGSIDDPRIQETKWWKELQSELNKELKVDFKPEGPKLPLKAAFDTGESSE